MPDHRLLAQLGDKYRVLAQLGEGGTARVWLAMSRGPSGFNKLVVLKTIRRELFDDDHVVEMFLEEARLTARLNHPNIVQTNEVFKEGKQPVIVMEYLEGLTFSVVLERQREGNALALAMLLRIVSDALAGLHAAHELRDYDGTDLRVVHRDVSPHNLFVTFAGEVKVLDFGIAQLTTSRDSTDSGAFKGKLRYVAPEQVSGDRRVDRRADIYSMGVVLWEVAAARRMWTGVPDGKILQRILAADLPRLEEVAPAVDAELVTIVEKALSRDAQRRYSSALEFQADLDKYVASLGAPLRNRDIGRALSKMFEDVRRERQETIERQLARTDTLAEIQVSQGPLPELTSFSTTHGRASHASPKSDRRQGILLGTAVAAMALFFAALFWAPDPARNKATPSPQLESNLGLRPQVSPKPDRVLVRITAFPRNAELFLDGTQLPANPFMTSFERDEVSAHRLEVRADGYEPEVHTLVYRRDQEVVLNLARRMTEPDAKPAPRPALVPSPRPEVRSPQSAPPADPAGSPLCSPPYYYDERGVKKYRPECL